MRAPGICLFATVIGHSGKIDLSDPVKTHRSSFIKLLNCAALACTTACVLQALDASSRRVTGEEKAAGAEVRR